MRENSSSILYAKYISCPDDRVEMTLKSGRIIRGKIVGYFYKDSDSEIPVISKWRIVDEKDTCSTVLNSLNISNGEIITHKEISEVNFLYDKSKISF